VTVPHPAHAETSLRFTDYLETVSSLDRHEFAALTLTLGVILFGVVTAITLLRTRTRTRQALVARQSEINDLREERDRAVALLHAEPQVVVVWPAGADEPAITGDAALVAHTAVPRRVLAFGTWLEPDKAQQIEEAVDALRNDGKGFSLILTTLHHRHVVAEGRAIGGRAVLRIKDLTGPQSQLAELAADHQQLRRDIDTIGRFLEALPAPVWARDAAGRLTWVNAAYARAVEARDDTDAVARNLEILDSASREDVARSRDLGEVFEARCR
jgi:PAS domain-containing protein